MLIPPSPITGPRGEPYIKTRARWPVCAERYTSCDDLSRLLKVPAARRNYLSALNEHCTT